MWVVALSVHRWRQQTFLRPDLAKARWGCSLPSSCCLSLDPGVSVASVFLLLSSGVTSCFFLLSSWSYTHQGASMTPPVWSHRRVEWGWGFQHTQVPARSRVPRNACVVVKESVYMWMFSLGSWAVRFGLWLPGLHDSETVSTLWLIGKPQVGCPGPGTIRGIFILMLQQEYDL